jgi:hypothetical protein
LYHDTNVPVATQIFKTTTAPKKIAAISAECAKILRDTKSAAGHYLEARAIRNANAKQPRYDLQALRTVCSNEADVQKFAYGKNSVKKIVKQELAAREVAEKKPPQIFAEN